MIRVIQLTRAWAAATGLVLIAVMIVLAVTGHSVTHALPMLLSAIVGYEVALIGYDFWRKRRHG